MIQIFPLDHYKIISIFFILLAIFIFFYKRKPTPYKHLLKIKAAKKLRSYLSKIDNPAIIFRDVRRADPFVVEELVLESFASRKHTIQRNTAYSGDGGIDGQVLISGNHFFIQTKAYSNHIKRQDVEAFSKLCVAHRTYGLFVHSGVTGAASKADHYPNIGMISGANFHQLVTTTKPLKIYISDTLFVII